jgi:hypothetical protein
VPVPLDVKRGGLVIPGDLVEVEQLRELALTVVCEVDALVRKGWGGPCLLCAAPLGQLPLLDSRSVCFRRIFDRAVNRTQFAQIAGQLIANLVDRDDGAENTLSRTEEVDHLGV